MLLYINDNSTKCVHACLCNALNETSSFIPSETTFFCSLLNWCGFSHFKQQTLEAYNKVTMIFKLVVRHFYFVCRLTEKESEKKAETLLEDLCKLFFRIFISRIYARNSHFQSHISFSFYFFNHGLLSLFFFYMKILYQI